VRKVKYNLVEDKEWLRKKYWDERLTLDQIGELVGLTKGAVRYYMEKHGIKRRSLSRKKEVKCDECGKSFLRKPSHIKEHNFCSKECFDRWQRGRRRSNKRIKVKCAICGKEIERDPCKVKRNVRFFCSKECQYEGRKKFGFPSIRGKNHPNWKGGNPKSICQWCGNEFIGWRRNPNKFCSKECLYKWLSEKIVGENNPHYNRVIIRCDNCGKILKRIPSWVKKTKHHFCDMKCRNEFWFKDRFPAIYGYNWEKIRRKVLERDKFTCQICGKRKVKLDVHHITRTGDLEKDNRLSNLITLCDSCQGRVERSKQLGAILPIIRNDSLERSI
jgi:5-methylcytosine-specific restriction endonuclease McrA/predicted transcriptional regulator